jgi:hypothetical protein
MPVSAHAGDDAFCTRQPPHITGQSAATEAIPACKGQRDACRASPTRVRTQAANAPSVEGNRTRRALVTST